MEEAQQRQSQRKQALHTIVDQLQTIGLVDSSTARFLLSKSDTNRFPNFRINVKVHKTPIASRPLVNLRQDLLGPLAQFLNYHLLDLQNACKHVVQNSAEVVRSIEGITLNTMDFLVTFDFESLYPNLSCSGHELSVGSIVSDAIFSYYVPKGQASLADFLVRILCLLITDSIVQNTADGSGDLFRQMSGLTTGLSAASTIANIYLAHGFDIHFTSLLRTRYYARYIDDGLAIVSSEEGTVDNILEACNSWHRSLSVPAKDCTIGKHVHFLDLNIFASSDGRITFNTYRKPQAIFDYIPTESAHAPSTFRGMIAGECCRLLVTNSSSNDYVKQISFFKQKLARRGFNYDTINRIVSKYPFSKRLSILRPRQKKVATSKQKIFGHGVFYFPGIQTLPWKRVRNIQNSLAKHVGQCKVRTFHRVRPNLFLRLYTASWRPKHTRLVAG